MAAIPILMTSAEWLSKTNVKKMIGKGDKTRSGPLGLVDQYVLQYQTTPQAQTLENLKMNLEVWMSSKTKSDGSLDTIREHRGAVSDLKRQVDLATRLLPPLEWNRTYPGIFIGQDIYRGIAWVPDDFPGTVNDCLDEIASKPIGKALLKSISDRCLRDTTKKVVIEYTSVYSSAAPVTDVSDVNRKKVQGPTGEKLKPQELLKNPDLVAKEIGVQMGGKMKDYIGGAGTSAVITFKHTDKGLDGRPVFIALAHELVHAYHYVNGLCYRAADGGIADGGNTGIMEEEMRTVGMLKYKDEIPSENAIRGEHRVTLRTEYTPGVDFSKVSASIMV
jgi:hypothetical protein